MKIMIGTATQFGMAWTHKNIDTFFKDANHMKKEIYLTRTK